MLYKSILYITISYHHFVIQIKKIDTKMLHFYRFIFHYSETPLKPKSPSKKPKL